LGKQSPINDKGVLRLIAKIGGGTRSERGECNWHRATTVSFERIINVMGWKILITWLYSPVFLRVKH